MSPFIPPLYSPNGAIARVVIGAVFEDLDTVIPPVNRDTPNDDPDDEDEGQYGGLLYVIDAPGRYGLPGIGSGNAKYYYGDNFSEYIRVSVDGERPTGNTNVGSRASDKFKWHSQSYIEVNNGVWVRAATFNDIGLLERTTAPPGQE